MSNKEALEVIPSNENTISIVYEQPLFHKRVFANFIDILLLVLAFICSFSLMDLIVHSTPTYKHADKVVATYREESKMFKYASSRGTWENISTWLDNNNDLSYGTRNYQCQVAIDGFIDYIGSKFGVGSDEHQFMIDDYRDCRLSENLKLDGKALFIEQEDEETHEMKIIFNPEIPVNEYNSRYYYSHFYREYTLIHCGGYMIKVFPEYRNGLKTMSNLLFYCQLPCAVLLSGFLVYLLPTFFWRRNRMTIGKFSMQIGIVNSQCFAVSFGRNLARWSIFFFLEVVLSFFTFGLPFIISFSMMAFTKKKQGFPDYMLGITEVDVNKQKIYYTKYEVALEHTSDHKTAVEFEMEHSEHL